MTPVSGIKAEWTARSVCLLDWLTVALHPSAEVKLALPSDFRLHVSLFMAWLKSVPNSLLANSQNLRGKTKRFSSPTVGTMGGRTTLG